MGPMGTKSRLCLGCSSMVITGYAIGCQCPADSGRFIIPSTCATLRRLSSVCCSWRNRTLGPLGTKHRSTWTLALTRGWSKCHRQHVNVNRILMPLICHKYIWCIWEHLGNIWFFPVVGGMCVISGVWWCGASRSPLGAWEAGSECFRSGEITGKSKENHHQMPNDFWAIYIMT